jgi:SAM-dependent methyltransferase
MSSRPGPAQPHRVHIGAGDPLGYPPPARAFFGDGTWVHLHAPGETVRDAASPLRRMASGIRQRLSAAARARRAANQQIRAEARRRYMPFWLDDRRALPFRDRVFTFALSEHVLEHLFLHEAFRLMQEVGRVLSPGGVFRVSVPDADLRPDGLEPLAFHAGRGRTAPAAGRWNDPDVHKTRWNIYSMTLLLERAGFTVVPVRAWDRHGTRVDVFPAARRPPYPDGADWEALLRSDYLRRPESLIVDAIALR